jgi:hypothetical protein
MSYPWGHNRRFNAYANYFKNKFGGRVQKLAVDAGFNCPNRDGTVGYGGCAYCNNNAFNPSYCHPGKTIQEQIEEGIEFHKTRYRDARQYLVYFQAYSNTYAPLGELKEKYETALRHPGVIGLVIGTRPDCIDTKKLEYIQALAKQYFIVIEYGVESCYDQTLEYMNRGHDYKTAVDAIRETHRHGIHAGAHFIFGLPGETIDDMLLEARIISELPLHSVKFHQLQIVKDTLFARLYKQKPSLFQLFSLPGYLDFLVRFVERLNPRFIIERFAGEAPPRFLLTKSWGVRNYEILQKLEKRMEEQDVWQGKAWDGGTG